MSLKFDYMLEMLNRIDRGELVTKNSLMNDFEISERSVYRYIETLKNSRFPIIFDRQKESYVFEEGYSLSKPALSAGEALAFALAKEVLKNFGDSVEKNLESIENKLKVKKKGYKDSIVLPLYKRAAEIKGFLETIHEAINEGKRLEMIYFSHSSGEESNRKIDPYFLFFAEGFWYIRAFSHDSEEFRVFAVDGIRELKTLSEYYIRQLLSPEDELSSSFGAWLDGESITAVLRFDKEVADQVTRKQFVRGQKERRLPDGRVEIEMTTRNNFGLMILIYKWLPFVEVVKPASLRKAFRGQLAAAAGKNK